MTIVKHITATLVGIALAYLGACIFWVIITKVTEKGIGPIELSPTI